MTLNLPAERPRCRQHGYMVLRPASRQTPEQQFCGVWYDCPEFTSATHRCGSSACYPSRGLCQQTGEPYFDGSAWSRHDSMSWVPITDAEATEFFRLRQASIDASLAVARQHARRGRRTKAA